MISLIDLKSLSLNYYTIKYDIQLTDKNYLRRIEEVHKKINGYFLNIKFYIRYIFFIFNFISLFLLKGSKIPLYKNTAKKIKLGTMVYRFKNGGVEKITSLLLQELSKINMFSLYLITGKKENQEYIIPSSAKRLSLFKDNKLNKNLLIFEINKYKLDLLIYNSYEFDIMKLLKNLGIKIIVVNHSSFLFWLYAKEFIIFRYLFEYYKSFDLVICLIPNEGKYLYKKWGITNIITMNNLLPTNVKENEISDLSLMNIIMVGRGDDNLKNFQLGIKAMKYISKILKNAKLIIVSSGDLIKLVNLTKELDIEKNVLFTGYSNNPGLYFKKSSVHLFTSYVEAFPNVLSESKLYGVPTILIGLEYLSMIKGGTVIADDNPISIANETIKILTNEKYRKKLGKEARDSLNQFSNEITLQKWINIINYVYTGRKNISEIIEDNKGKVNESEALSIINKEIKKLKKRIPEYKFLEINNILNYTYMRNLETYFKKYNKSIQIF